MKRWMTILLAAIFCMSAALAETMYYNPDGGTRYHADMNCPSTNRRYLPMKPIDLADAKLKGLKICSVCVQEETDELWYDPWYGVHFHKGSCAAAADGAHARGSAAMRLNEDGTADTISADEKNDPSRLLFACPVCRPLGDETQVFLLHKGKASMLHASWKCAGVTQYDAFSGIGENIRVGELDNEQYAMVAWCPLCMGDDQATVHCYINAAGGKMLHKTRQCVCISAKYFPYMKGLTEKQADEYRLNGMEYCDHCW